MKRFYLFWAALGFILACSALYLYSYIPNTYLVADQEIKKLFEIDTPLQRVAKIIEAAKIAHAHHFIEQLENGYDTIIGERGNKLSGGQKQRISIARALLKKPRLLILDDCLSAVDTETEEIILRNLEKDIDKRTSIIISHRISTIRNATKIIVISDGAITEQGSHDELISLKGTYFELYEKQLQQDKE